MKYADFIHPEDAAALRQIESIPGFPALVKKFLSLGLEQLQYGINMATNIRLSETQLPQIYNHLPPICQIFGIEEPEFYLKMDPTPNAWTSGDTKIYIVVTSGLVEMMSDDELDAVLAHECGHILCRHVLYHTVASYILDGADRMGILGNLTIPIQYAMLYWMRKSELSCDRAAAIVTSPETVSSVMARLAGGPRHITENINLVEWAQQGEQYESIRTDGLWNKSLQIYAISSMSHPFSAVRVREILKWGVSDQYWNIKNNISQKLLSGPICPRCGNPIEKSWKYCLHCGSKL